MFKASKDEARRMRGRNQNMPLLWHVCHRQLRSSGHFVMMDESCKRRHERTNVVNRDINVQMVARSRRERMVAHNITDPPLLHPLMRSRRTLFEENSSVMRIMLRTSVAPIDEIQVEPCLMMAALIGRAQALSFMWYGESAVKSYFPVPI